MRRQFAAASFLRFTRQSERQLRGGVGAVSSRGPYEKGGREPRLIPLESNRMSGNENQPAVSAFGHDRNLERDGNFGGQANGDFVIADGFNRFVEMNFAPVDVESFGFQSLFNVNIRH